MMGRSEMEGGRLWVWSGGGCRQIEVSLDKLVVCHILTVPNASISQALSGYSGHCPTPLHLRDGRSVIGRRETSPCFRTSCTHALLRK